VVLTLVTLAHKLRVQGLITCERPLTTHTLTTAAAHYSLTTCSRSLLGPLTTSSLLAHCLGPLTTSSLLAHCLRPLTTSSALAVWCSKTRNKRRKTRLSDPTQYPQFLSGKNFRNPDSRKSLWEPDSLYGSPASLYGTLTVSMEALPVSLGP
jgi:hypothetical protein